MNQSNSSELGLQVQCLERQLKMLQRSFFGLIAVLVLGVASGFLEIQGPRAYAQDDKKSANKPLEVLDENGKTMAQVLPLAGMESETGAKGLSIADEYGKVRMSFYWYPKGKRPPAGRWATNLSFYGADGNVIQSYPNN